MNKLANKLKTLTVAQLRETLLTIKDQSGPHIATLWLETINELESRLGEEAFWDWADKAL